MHSLRLRCKLFLHDADSLEAGDVSNCREITMGLIDRAVSVVACAFNTVS
jgi:hypothetical protein